MANIDYQEAKNEILKIFNSNDTGVRKIVFWYDALVNFKDDLINDSFDICKVLFCDKNEFMIKKTIEKDDLSSNFLIYIPYPRPIDSQNWLLDILMYSDEYYADTVALTMRHLGLSNPDLRNIISKHTKFFDSASRNKKLSSYVLIDDSMNSDDFSLAMMCVLTKASFRSIESVLTELIFDDNQSSKYKELKKFGFEDYLWERIAREYNYDGDQKIEVLIKKFLFTALFEQKVDIDNLPSFYNQFKIIGPGKMDAKFFVDRIKLDPRYRDLQFSLAIDLKIEGLFAGRDISSFESCDVFECIDSFIIKQIAESLLNGSIDFDRFDRIISIRENLVWYDLHKLEYDFLSVAIKFYRLRDKKILPGLSSVDYIKLYVDDYYLFDTLYRKTYSFYHQIQNPIEELAELISRIDIIYGDTFLSSLGSEYSKSLTNEFNWNFTGINKSCDFYQMIQKFQFKKLFVIISDALRFEIGKEIVDVIKKDVSLRGNVSLDYAISPLPSETRFGMASLLPHKSISFLNGNVLVDGKSTNGINARNAILHDKNPSYAAINYYDIVNLSRDDLRAFMADKSIVYIYHNVIDNAGEHNENKVFDVVDSAITEIVSLVRRLYNQLQISNFFITADHGFLYKQMPITESEKYPNIIPLKPVEASKRYLIADSDINIPYSNEFKLSADESDYKVITPFAYDIFKTQGAGVQFVHGGASLQETIVPVIHISELNAKKGEKLAKPVGVRLKSIMRKITNRSFSLDFEQYEKVEDKIQPANCITYFVDDNGNKVSGEYNFVANSSSDDLDSRVTKIRFTLKNIQFDRNERYYLILQNTDNLDEFIEKEQFTFDILNLKVF